MADPVNRLRVFVASPGDTQEERNRLSSVVEEINRGIAADQDVLLELVRWETHVRPGIGSDAQDVVNRQIPDADIVIGLFWKRLGTPTPRAESGTAEELEAAIEQWRKQSEIEILTYFNRNPYTLSRDEVSQLERLLAFREKLESQGMLVSEYEGVPDFEAKVRQHLTAAVRDWSRQAPQRKGQLTKQSALERKALSPEAIQVDVDVAREGDVQTLVSELRTELLKKGFGTAAATRAATVLLELLANVRNHSASKDATVEVEMRTGAIFCAVLKVAHQGSAFDLGKALSEGRWSYQQGDREHGLVKVSRLASHLFETKDSEGRICLECFVYDPPPLGSGTFDDLDGVTPVYLEFDLPNRWRLGEEIYAGRDLENPLHFALEKPAPRLLDLYFGGMRVPKNGYMAIEFAGNVVPSEVGPIPIVGEVAEIYPQPRSEHAMEAALEVYFNDCFQSQRVVMHAYQTGFIPTARLQNWASLWDVPCFTRPDELQGFLTQFK